MSAAELWLRAHYLLSPTLSGLALLTLLLIPFDEMFWSPWLVLAAVPWGLGWMIFGAREFLNTDVMLAGVAVIGAIGLTLERLVFKRLEDFTVVRWGMMT